MMTHRNPPHILVAAWILLFTGCSGADTKPVDIHPEDMCAACKMAFSDQRFAAEIVTEQGEAFKFDDIACLEGFESKHAGLNIAAVYYRDFITKEWIPANGAVVIQTDLASPMGSGKVAFKDSTKAREFLLMRHPH